MAKRKRRKATRVELVAAADIGALTVLVMDLSRQLADLGGQLVRLDQVATLLATVAAELRKDREEHGLKRRRQPTASPAREEPANATAPE